jgi:hypothetical protein
MAHSFDEKRFGLALGLTKGIGMLALGVLATYFGWGVEVVYLLGTVYSGYEPTLLGSFMGAGWAVADGFICGALFAWFYNRV